MAMYARPPPLPGPPSPTNINIVHHHHPDGIQHVQVDVLEDQDIYTGHLHVERQEHPKENFNEGITTPGGGSVDGQNAEGGDGKVQNPPGNGPFKHRARPPPRRRKPIRLHIHILHSGQNGNDGVNIDIQFMTTADPRSSIFQLKKKIEAQFKSLFPESPPLTVRALADPSSYLLPDPLVVEDVLSPNAQVHVVVEGAPFSGVDAANVESQKWDPARVCTQTHGWITHAADFLSKASSDKAHMSREKAHAVLPLLCDLITCSIDFTRRSAGRALWRYSAFADFQQLAPKLSDAALRNVCGVARFSDREHQEVIKGCATFIYNASLYPGLGKRVAMARGREACMAISAHTNSADTREMATEGLMILDRLAEQLQLKTNKEDLKGRQPVHRRKDGALVRDPEQMARRKKESMQFASIEGSQWNQMMSTIKTLLESDREDAHVYIAELLNRAITQSGFIIHLQQREDAFQIIARVVATTDSGGKASESVASCMAELCSSNSGRKFLIKRAPFALLSQLCMSRDSLVRTNAVAVMREICGDKQLPLIPTEWLLALARSPVVEAQRAATKGLSLSAARDSDNALRPHIAVIVALAMADDPFVQRFAAEALGSLAMKELNKRDIVKAGGMEVFASFLTPEAEVELQRIGAKAMANLSSTDRVTRQAVIRYVQKTVPNWQNFSDHIVNVYLEMMFTN